MIAWGGSKIKISGKITALNHNKVLSVWLLALILIILAQAAYRVTASRQNVVDEHHVELDTPLSEFPVEIGNWSGKDIDVSETVLAVADNDDYLMRSYSNTKTGQSVSLYIGYSSQPLTMIGHKPQICYPSSGWVHKGTDKHELMLNSGISLPYLLHRFSKPAEGGNVIVLNYYILNGRITTEEKDFTGLSYRTSVNPAESYRYVTQVQVVSYPADSAITAASEFSDLILDFFPGTGTKNTKQQKVSSKK